MADLLPGAKLVKAFNTLQPSLVAVDPRVQGGRRVVFYSGDHAGAKQRVAQLIEQLGFVGIDLGSLVVGGRLQQFPGGSLPTRNLIQL